MRKLTLVAAAVSSALLMSATLPAQALPLAFPGGVADSRLDVSNFSITGDIAAAGGFVGAVVTGQVNTSINFVPGTNQGGNPSGSFIFPLTPGNPTLDMRYLAGGPSPGFPLISLATGTMNAGTYAASTLNHQGNALNLNGAGLTQAKTHNQVNLDSTAAGSADSRQTLLTSFTIAVVGDADFTVAFAADAALRAALAQPLVSANAGRGWQLTVDLINANGAVLANVLNWIPNGIVSTAGLGGTCVGAALCTEIDDDFSLNTGVSQLFSPGDSGLITNTGDFELDLSLESGTYRINIVHTTNADANVIPEPGSLALLGAALLGLVGLRRKSKKA